MPLRLTPDNHFSVVNLKAKKAWLVIIQSLRHHRWKLWLLYTGNLLNTGNRERKTFQNQARFKYFYLKI